jgi:hypothetical protein
MNKKNFINFFGTILIVFIALTANAAAETQCVVSTAGPYSLVGHGPNVKICANNFWGNDTIKVGIASYSTFHANEPVDLQFIELDPRKGTCVYPDLKKIGDFDRDQFEYEDLSETFQKRKRHKKIREVIFTIGFLTDNEDPAPLVLTVQRRETNPHFSPFGTGSRNFSGTDTKEPV